MIKVASLFSQLLHHFSRKKFAHLLAKYQTERRAKDFTCWTQMVAMLFCHMAHADSLREICGELAVAGIFLDYIVTGGRYESRKIPTLSMAISCLAMSRVCVR